MNLVSSLPEAVITDSGEESLPDDTPEERAPAVLSAEGEAGKRIYSESQPPCGACHTLADAGTEGLVGPNLDSLKPDAATVEAAVSGGVGAMPAYENKLSGEEIRQLATYLEEATR